MQQLQVELCLSLVATLGLFSGHFNTFITFRMSYLPCLQVSDLHMWPHDPFECSLLVMLGGFGRV